MPTTPVIVEERVGDLERRPGAPTVLTPGDTCLLRFASVDNPVVLNHGVDDVSITARFGPVPEPSTWMFVLNGAALLFLARMRTCRTRVARCGPKSPTVHLAAIGVR